jgi:hypothetical protein
LSQRRLPLPTAPGQGGRYALGHGQIFPPATDADKNASNTNNNNNQNDGE